MPCRIVRVPAEMDSPSILAWLKERKDPGLDVTSTVRTILDDVRRHGDQALRRYTRRFDAPDLPAHMGVPVRTIRSALKQVPAADLDILREAVVTGVRIQMRSILLTTGTTIAGLLPLLYKHDLSGGKDIWENLALSTIGGLTSSTVLTLGAIPAFYWMFSRWGWSSHWV